MNILLCGASMRIGGAETHMLTLAIGLVEKGHRVVVAAERGVLCEELKKHGIRFVQIPISSNHISNMLKSYKMLKGLIERSEFDVVHAHSRISAFLIEKIRGKVNKKFKFIVTAHARYRTNEVLKRASAWGDVCIAVSKDIKAHLMKNYGLPASKIFVVPNGIDTERYFPASRGSKHTVLFVSRLDCDCSAGAKLLCRIAPELFENFKRLKITIAGGGNDFQEVKRLADRANAIIGKEIVKLTGDCNDIVPLLEEHEYIVGVSRVALEAMSMKKSVVLFGNEGALGLLTEKNLGLAESSNFTCRGYGKNINSGFLLSELYTAFRMDDKKKKRTAEIMRREVVEKYSHELVRDMILKLYKINRLSGPKILIGGYYGQGNVGDERVLETLCCGLKNNIPNCNIRVIKGGTPSFWSVNRKDPAEIIKAFNWSDVYISGGGSLFQNTTSTRSLIYYCALIDMARKLNNKVIVFSNGIGPLKGKFAEKLTKKALLKADYVSVRDVESFFKVISLTGGKVLPQLSADPVFAAKHLGLKDEQNGKMKKGLMDFGGKYAVVALNGRMGKLNRALSIAIRDYCSEHEMLPIFVSMDTNNDTNAAKEGAEICHGMLLDRSDSATLNDVISRASLAIGARFHFLIFALCRGIRIVPINSDLKINALSNEIFSSQALKIGKRDTVSSIVRKITRFLSADCKECDACEREEAIENMSKRALADIQRVSSLCSQSQ